MWTGSVCAAVCSVKRLPVRILAIATKRVLNFQAFYISKPRLPKSDLTKPVSVLQAFSLPAHPPIYSGSELTTLQIQKCQPSDSSYHLLPAPCTCPCRPASLHCPRWKLSFPVRTYKGLCSWLLLSPQTFSPLPAHPTERPPSAWDLFPSPSVSGSGFPCMPPKHSLETGAECLESVPPAADSAPNPVGSP